MCGGHGDGHGICGPGVLQGRQVATRDPHQDLTTFGEGSDGHRTVLQADSVDRLGDDEVEECRDAWVLAAAFADTDGPSLVAIATSNRDV